MATVRELLKSRNARQSTGAEEITKIWVVTGTTDAAINDSQLPSIGDGYPARPDLICVDKKSDYFSTDGSNSHSLVTARFTNDIPILQNVGDLKFDYDFTAKTENVRYAPRVNPNAITNEGRYPDGQGVKRPIGQFGDSGVSAYRPQFALKVTKLYDYASLNATYTYIYSSIGRVNREVWNGFPIYSMLFIGGAIPQTGNDRWTGNFSFLWDEASHDYPWFVENTKTKVIEGPIWSELYRGAWFDYLQLHQVEV